MNTIRIDAPPGVLVTLVERWSEEVVTFRRSGVQEAGNSVKHSLNITLGREDRWKKQVPLGPPTAAEVRWLLDAAHGSWAAPEDAQINVSYPDGKSGHTMLVMFTWTRELVVAP